MAAAYFAMHLNAVQIKPFMVHSFYCVCIPELQIEQEWKTNSSL